VRGPITTESENLDVRHIADLCQDILVEDWTFGPKHTKLRLIVALAERLDSADE